MEQLLEMRRIAQKALTEVNAQDVMRRAIKGRSRVPQEFNPGDYVFVYRVPRGRKKKDGSKEQFEVASLKPTWVGSGTVLLPDGPNVWVTMLGGLWKVAREQCRLATNDEKMGIEAVLLECRELVEEYKRNPHRAGYKDMTNEEWPPIEDVEGNLEDHDSPRHPQVKRGIEDVDEEPEEAPSDGYSPATPVPTPPHSTAQTISSNLSEPEIEATPATPPPGQADTHAANTAATTDEVYRRSQEMANKLDGLPPPGTPLRVRGTSAASNPYIGVAMH